MKLVVRQILIDHLPDEDSGTCGSLATIRLVFDTAPDPTSSTEGEETTPVKEETR